RVSSSRTDGECSSASIELTRLRPTLSVDLGERRQPFGSARLFMASFFCMGMGWETECESNDQSLISQEAFLSTAAAEAAAAASDDFDHFWLLADLGSGWPGVVALLDEADEEETGAEAAVAALAADNII
ncbi:hypothetical protein BpHYR1_011150, partial [Brachionus plicatilis]